MVLDTTKQMEAALLKVEPKMVGRFTALALILRSEVSVQALASIIEGGTVQQALDLITRSTPSINSTWIRSFVATAEGISTSIGGAIGAPAFDFDQTTARVVEQMRSNVDRIQRAYILRQNLAALEAANQAIREGLDSVGVANRIRDSIGLSANQQRSLDRLRLGLSREGQRRRPKSARQIEGMVEQHRKRLLRARTRNLGSREAIRAIHEASEAAFQQAVDLGIVREDDIRRQWKTEGDSKVRGSHRPMNGQVRGLREPFITGRGARLRFPTDPRAPIEEIAECRCLVAHQLG